MTDATTTPTGRDFPWRIGTGTSFDEPVSTKQAIVDAGLDWTVELEPVYLAGGVEIPGRFATVRQSDRQPLGLVSKRYQVLQNVEAFDFLDGLVDDGSAQITDALAAKGGKHIMLVAKLPEALEVAGEQHHVHLILATAHDGTRAVTVFTNVTRLLCLNALPWTLPGHPNKWSVPHTSSIAGKMHEAKETLGLARDYVDSFAQLGETLASFELSDKRFRSMLERTLPDRPQRDELIATIVKQRELSATVGDEHRSTAWGAYNALTEHLDWTRRGVRPGEARLINTVNGQSAKLRSRFAAILEAAA